MGELGGTPLNGLRCYPALPLKPHGHHQADRARRPKMRAPASGRVEYFDTLLPGFGLRVTAGGAKSWIVMTRVHGKLKRVTLGRYPALGLADARDQARKVIADAQEGKTPLSGRARRRRSTATRSPTCSPSTSPATSAEGPAQLARGRADADPRADGRRLDGPADRLDRPARRDRAARRDRRPRRRRHGEPHARLPAQDALLGGRPRRHRGLARGRRGGARATSRRATGC